MAKLTTARIKALKTTGKAKHYADESTLYLRVGPTGAKSWIQRIHIDGRRREIGLGGWPLVSIAEAREAAFENRRIVRAGGDPLAERRKAAVPTFEEAARRTMDANAAKWRNGKTAANWQSRLESYAFPAFGRTRVDRVTTVDVLKVLSPLWTAKPEVARKVRQYVKATFAWCQAHGYVESNPAGEAISGALPKMPAVRSHFRALPYAEVGTALPAVNSFFSTMRVEYWFLIY